MKKFLIRTASGTVYVLLMLGAIYGGRLLHNEQLGSVLFSLVFFAISIIGTHEVVCNLRQRGEQLNAPAAYGLSLLTYVLLAPIVTISPCALLLPLIVLAPFVVMLLQLWRNEANPIASIGYTLLPTLWVVLPLTMLSYLHADSPGLVMMLFILIWVNDSMAYMSGMLMGRHPLWARHSPGKTWEGTIGGALCCIAVALMVGPHFDTPFQSLSAWALIGMACSVVGTLGDLVESMFKRYCGVKDSGNIMPGHGGILDRFDSLLLTTPFVFVLWALTVLLNLD